MGDTARYYTNYRVAESDFCYVAEEDYCAVVAERDAALLELDDIRGIIGSPGTDALKEAGLSESLPDCVRYTHRQWLSQLSAANQRVLAVESRLDKAREALFGLLKRAVDDYLPSPAKEDYQAIAREGLRKSEGENHA